jgi:hypothetical protein
MRKTFITVPSSPRYKRWASACRPFCGAVIGWVVLLLSLQITACSSTPTPASTPAVQADPTTESWYTETIEKLSTLTAEARTHFEAGRRTEASSRIREAVPLSRKLLEIPRPNLEAMQAASDLDQLYGDMLMDTRHYGHAREFYQKNVARWRHWQPQTDDTRRRLKEATAAIARCDEQLFGKDK